jgi:hypothetical protein
VEAEKPPVRPSMEESKPNEIQELTNAIRELAAALGASTTGGSK